MTVLIDSWAWIEYLKGTPKGSTAKKFIEGEEDIVISTINIAEVYKYYLSRQPEKAKSIIEELIGRTLTVPVGTTIALEAARIRHEKKFGLGDAIILATAREKNARIVTGDPDFKNEKETIFIG